MLKMGRGRPPKPPAAEPPSDTDARALLHEIGRLRRLLTERDAALASGRAQLDHVRGAQVDAEAAGAEAAARAADASAAAARAAAAVEHRDAVIAELAASRRAVFEECHRACAANQAELRQMQEALARAGRTLARERRDAAARADALRRQCRALRAAAALSPRGSNNSGWDFLDGGGSPGSGCSEGAAAAAELAPRRGSSDGSDGGGGGGGEADGADAALDLLFAVEEAAAGAGKRPPPVRPRAVAPLTPAASLDAPAPAGGSGW
jgi:hypothetical protein